MERGGTIHTLRQMRALERRYRGGEHSLFDRFFALEEGVPARYPLRTLLVLDQESRSRIFNEYLAELFSGSTGDSASTEESSVASPSALAELRNVLGVSADDSPAAVRRAFRRTLLDLHPDQGGDNELTQELIALYRKSFG